MPTSLASSGFASQGMLTDPNRFSVFLISFYLLDGNFRGMKAMTLARALVVGLTILIASGSNGAIQPIKPPMQAVVIRGYGGTEVWKLEAVRDRNRKKRNSDSGSGRFS